MLRFMISVQSELAEHLPTMGGGHLPNMDRRELAGHPHLPAEGGVAEHHSPSYHAQPYPSQQRLVHGGAEWPPPADSAVPRPTFTAAHSQQLDAGSLRKIEWHQRLLENMPRVMMVRYVSK